MSFRQNHESGNKAVTLLATCFVVLGGAISLTAIVVATNPQHLDVALTAVGGAISGIVILLWLVRARPPESRARVMWGWLARRRKRRVAYHVKPRVPPGERTPAPAGPPTANSIREITGRSSTWVPAATTRPQPPQNDPHAET
jgi:hypothetical protein